MSRLVSSYSSCQLYSFIPFLLVLLVVNGWGGICRHRNHPINSFVLGFTRIVCCLTSVCWPIATRRKVIKLAPALIVRIDQAVISVIPQVFFYDLWYSHFSEVVQWLGRSGCAPPFFPIGNKLLDKALYLFRKFRIAVVSVGI